VPLYKVEEMCERCAAAWHAVMAASLLDSVVISQQFLGQAPMNKLEAQFLHVENGSNGASVHGRKVRAHAGTKRGPRAAPKAHKAKPPKLPKAAKATKAIGGGSLDAGVEPTANGKYSTEDRGRLIARYQTLPRSAKAAFNLRYKIKAWQMRDWAK
jgi:hypothetical protein